MFGKNASQQQYPEPTCRCGNVMTFAGQHGIRLGGITGIKAAALDFFGGQLGQEANEAFEKKLSTELFICQKCGSIEFKYLGGV
ncbi:hypothetical protein ACJU26_09150 [Acidithiobacillus sp. M4-SHS-6]|uniref:hypothetical protein n=1 Tax=Acidithiobacillus sp. M4-SHS-6 TaxID=3383024 RepID=UPI0039BDC7FA